MFHLKQNHKNHRKSIAKKVSK